MARTLAQWRAIARTALSINMPPSQLAWRDDGSATHLFGEDIAPSETAPAGATVPRRFVALAGSVACHRDELRWTLLYELLWRLTHGEPHLLEIASDPLMHRLVRLHRAVRRASHKMKAFVRFRAVQSPDGEEFIAWFEPAACVVERTAPFFVDRFPSMRWAILTPDGCARWDLATLTISPGIEKHEAPATDDSLEDLWRTYYAGIFNPARLNRDAMRAEMPRHYWKNLPEARIIESLAREAPARVTRMIEQTLAAPTPLPDDLEAREAIAPTPTPPGHEPWDETHDPGWREALRRERLVPDRWPEGLMINGTTVLAGVAGWTDPSILASGVFYPSHATSAESRLRYYAEQLPMVEVDATYYALPSEETSRRWVERTPGHFVFNIKAHALMTGHPTDPARLPTWLKEDLPPRLRSVRNVYAHHFSSAAIDEAWQRFLSALAPLRAAGKLGAVMLQFPKWFTPSPENLASFARMRERLGDCPASVEVRHRDWLADGAASRLFDALREQRFTYVCVDAPEGWESSVPATMRVTNPDLAIIRFHGRRSATWEDRHEDVAERFRYLYSEGQLDGWLGTLARTIDESRRVHLTFNNNKWNYAATNAIEMNAVVKRAFSPVSS
ncbi:MAG: TIGR03915 family putative DNA repair protein [bacterium]